MSILYTSGNTNLKTVRLVAFEMKNQIGTDQNTAIKKVVLFSSPNAYAELDAQSAIYREVFGNEIRIEAVPLDIDGNANAMDFSEVFHGKQQKYVDITNGQKTTAAQLYLSASLLGIENIFYISLLTQPDNLHNPPIAGLDYKIIQVPPFKGVRGLSKISYFDLIYYLEETDKIFSEVADRGFLSKTQRDIQAGIVDFFQNTHFRSVISNTTTSSEQLIKSLIKYLSSYEPAKRICQENHINLNQQKDALGAITFFFHKYRERIESNRDENLELILTIPSLLTPFRAFRNLASHSGVSAHEFTASEARICINLAIELFRLSKSNTYFWKILDTKP
jgi:hypothetical protein